MLIVCMTELCLNIFPTVNLNGRLQTMFQKNGFYLSNDAEKGKVFELEYSKHLNALNNKNPVAPEILAVTEEMPCPYAKSLLNNRKFVEIPQLILNLYDKENYSVHYRNFKFYLQIGLKVTVVHKNENLVFRTQVHKKTYAPLPLPVCAWVTLGHRSAIYVLADQDNALARAHSHTQESLIVII